MYIPEIKTQIFKRPGEYQSQDHKMEKVEDKQANF